MASLFRKKSYLPVDPGDVGMQSSVKSYWQARPKPGQGIIWVDKKPSNVKTAPDELPENKRHAIVVRHQISCDGKKPYRLHSLVVQSLLLKEVLADVLADYPGVTAGLDDLQFETPFYPFVHRWDELEAAVQDNKGLTRAHVELLHTTLKEDLANTLNKRKDLIKHGVMTYAYLWTIFRPGDMIYSTIDGEDRILRFTTGSYTRDDGFLMSAEYIDWDGKQFGWATTTVKIARFAGTRKILELSVFPLGFHPEKEAAKAKILIRSRKFESLKGVHYRAYDGISRVQGMFGPSKAHVHGRIVIDAESFASFRASNEPALVPFVSTPTPVAKLKKALLATSWRKNEKGRVEDSSDSEDDDLPPEMNPYQVNVGLPSGALQQDADYRMQVKLLALENQKRALQAAQSAGTVPGSGTTAGLNLASQSSSAAANVAPLTCEQLLLCHAMVKGYSLKTKRWGLFSVDKITDINWNDTAFESLVLPHDHKELILTFVESQALYNESFDDVIQGKGRGIIMLLSGPPGVGKTLTAESVAEHMRAPLYSIAAGELGLDPASVETKLSDILKMAMKWNAVVLLDEADVFLEARDLHDLERNKLVSVFLRTLEYFEGTLFLTTNRVKGIDQAFASRIHVSIEYPELSIQARRSVWTNFLLQIGIHKPGQTDTISKFTEEEVNKLAKKEMNGRQIKNAVKTAQLLARRQEKEVEPGHVWKVMSISDREGRAEVE